MSTKCVLKNKIFSSFSDKTAEFTLNFQKSVIGGILIFFIYNLPIIVINKFQNISIQTSIMDMISPFIIGTLVCGAYYIKKQADYKAIFENINKGLKDDAIKDEEEDYDNELENIIDYTCDLRLQLETELQKLTSVVLDDKVNVDNSMEKTNSDKLTYDKNQNIKKDLAIVDELMDKLSESNNEETESQVVRKLELKNDNK